MADILLAKPAAGASQTIPCAPEARFVFDFPATDATLARDGDDLAIQFEDGSRLNLEGFYTEYNEENLPSFSIDGTEVAAADFFAAMNEPDLMPAAGPGAGTTPTGGRFHEWGNADLADGIDHLNGLDWGFSRSFEWTEHPNAVGGGDDEGGLLAAAATVDHPVDVEPENPGDLPPDTPEIEKPGMELPRDILTVREEDLAEDNQPVATGAMDITAPDGVASIVIGGVTVWENGALTADPSVSTDEGVLTVTGFDPDTGRLEYSYTLLQATDEHGGEGKDHIAHNLTVTVTDGDGDTASSLITVVVQDDVPVVTGGAFTLGAVSETARDAASTSVADRFTVDAGADGEGSRTYSLSLGDNADGAACGLKALVNGTSADILLFRQEDGSIVGRAGDVDVFSVSIDQSGNVSVQMAGTATIDHSAFKGGNASLEGIKVVLDVTDGDGDHSTGELDLSIPISDSTGTAGSTQGEDSDVCRSSILLDFTNATQHGSTMDAFREQFKDDDPAWGNPSAGSGNQYTELAGGIHWITVKGIKLIPTRVEYDLDGGFHADNLVDMTSNIGSGFTDKNLNLTEDGLGMGISGNTGNWGGNEFGSGTDTAVPSGKGWAEGFVIEPQNGSVWYELDVELSNFAAGDRAVIYFYLTPQNNNDDSVVYAKEVSVADIDRETGSIKVEVPDGFTKAIIAAMPDAQGNASSFTVAKLNLSKNAVEHTGDITADAPDGVAGDVQWAWDWSDSGLDGRQVTVTNTPGAGDYTIRLISTGTDVEAVLVGNAGGEFSLNNNTLFKGHLDQATGKWIIDQFYKFESEGLDLVNGIKFGITGTDADGSAITGQGGVNMWLEAGVDRFDDVSVGYYNKEVWGADAKLDKAADIMAGNDGNDLMYGRGGDDILSGDGGMDAIEAIGKALTNYEGTTDALKYFAEHDGYDANGNPTIKPPQNWLTVEDVQERIESVIKGDANASWARPNSGPREFAEKLDAIEAQHPEWNGNDALYGGIGDDILLGWGGNDFLDGGEGKDMIFAGSGNDIIEFDRQDFVIDGGKGIDLLLASQEALAVKGDTPYTLRQLMFNNNGVDKGDKAGEGRPYVHNVEMMLIARHTNNVQNLGITSQAALAAYGIVVMGDHIELDSNLWKHNGWAGWEEKDPGRLSDPGENQLYSFTYDHDGVGLTLEIVKDANGFPSIKFKPFPKAEETEAQADDASAVVVASDDADDDGTGAEHSLAMNGHHAAPAAARSAHGGAEAPASEAQQDGQAADEGLDAFLSQVEALGGDRDDALIFGAGNDVVAGGEGRDFLYAGAGDDLIVYDPSDYLIDGGEGIDFLLAGADAKHSLADMLGNWERHGADNGMPMVHDVEVMLKGVDTSLQNMDALAKEYGFSMEKDADGKEILKLDSDKWHLDEEHSGNGTTTWVNADDNGITLETTLQHEGISADDHIVLVATNEVANGQG